MDEAATRTLVFLCLVTANIFLTLVNRSFFFSVIDTLSYRNKLLRGIILLTLALTVALLAIPAIRSFFGFAWPGWQALAGATAIGMASVLWFEVVKWRSRRKGRRTDAPPPAAG
jgi:Ca2+-transporting ATPase